MLKWLWHEFLNVLPVVLYFFLGFCIIHFTIDLLVQREGLKFGTISKIAVGALVAGKVLLIIDNLRFANAFSNKPLIFNTFWKTLIYSFAGLVFRLLEEFAHFVPGNSTMAFAYERFVGETDWPQFWAVQIWVVILFFTFSLARELILVMGKARLRQIFFGR